MGSERLHLYESLSTDAAHMWCFTRVYHHVHCEIAVPTERLLAYSANEVPDTGVRVHVPLHVLRRLEHHRTHRTLVRTDGRVFAHVPAQALLGEAGATLWA